MSRWNILPKSINTVTSLENKNLALGEHAQLINGFRPYRRVQKLAFRLELERMHLSL